SPLLYIRAAASTLADAEPYELQYHHPPSGTITSSRASRATSATENERRRDSPGAAAAGAPAVVPAPLISAFGGRSAMRRASISAASLSASSSMRNPERADSASVSVGSYASWPARSLAAATSTSACACSSVRSPSSRRAFTSGWPASGDPPSRAGSATAVAPQDCLSASRRSGGLFPEPSLPSAPRPRSSAASAALRFAPLLIARCEGGPLQQSHG